MTKLQELLNSENEFFAQKMHSSNSTFAALIFDVFSVFCLCANTIHEYMICQIRIQFWQSGFLRDKRKERRMKRKEERAGEKKKMKQKIGTTTTVLCVHNP